MLLEDVPVVVAVASGKGGVGKTRIAADLARTLNRQGNTVGLLDADISTPNILQEVAGEDFDVSQARLSDGERLLSVEVDGIHLFSQGLHLDDDVALLRGGGWRAESITNYIHTVDWPDETTHIVVDSPPGNGTEIQTVLAEAAPDYGFIVTTGANHSVRDARRTHELFIDADLPHTVIANMRRVELRPDWDGIREGVVDEVDGVGESRAETIVDILKRRSTAPSHSTTTASTSRTESTQTWSRTCRSRPMRHVAKMYCWMQLLRFPNQRRQNHERNGPSHCERFCRASSPGCERKS